ncbi:uncharacterized protein LOC143562129, partial [Bidens hawaiensis]|uniref:uncharacterized protein LOC143562129 n=1 Tax=Bidens hawaiensis TaxID=980011 RepID=UPI004049F503
YQTNSDEDDNESLNKQGVSLHVRTHSSEDDVSEKERLDTEDMPLVDHISKVTLVMKQITNLPLDSPKKSRLSRSSSRKLTTLDTKNHADDDATSAHDVSDDEDEPSLDKTVPKKSILKRIGSHKGTNSFQLGRQLSCKWSTGAGPRIGCLRDYPTEMQSHALEQANLSPESAPCSHKNINKSFFSRNCAPCSHKSSSPSQMIF